jgi:general secretion pathway protein B
MSYILEALKKAQAERQLGETPGIHAPVPEAPASTGAPLRKPFVAVVAAMAAVIAGLAVVVWRQAATPVQAVPVAQAQMRAPAVAPAVAPEAGIPAPAMPAAAQPAPGVVNRSAPEPAAQAVKERPSVPAVQSVQQTPPAPAPVVHDKAPPMAAAVPKSDEAPREEAVQALRDLPEPIRRAIPPVAMSGYMYSPNPADRLVLIDKVLRREGDEVAPGLVLERLEPKGAVFAFRDYRYRIPY